MAVNPLFYAEAMDRKRAEEISKNWWLLLVNGIISIIAGVLILSIPWTLVTLAIFVGAFLILRGIFQALSPPYSGRSQGWNVAIGIISVIVGIAIIASPTFAGFTLLVLATIIGIWIAVWGIAHIAGAISNRYTSPHWWLSLLAGIFAVALGIIALYEPILTLAVAVFVVGIWAIVIGVTEIALSYEIKRLPQTVDELQKASRGLVTAEDVERMATLRDRGVITEEEFERYKARRIA